MSGEPPNPPNSNNPYQSPAIDTPVVVGVLSGKREDLKAVAIYQKGILVCVLINLIVLGSLFALPPELRIAGQLLFAVVSLTGTVFVFLLAVKVYGAGWGIFYGVIALIPCIGLLALLSVNEKATDTLKKNGIKVGLLGANLSRI